MGFFEKQILIVITCITIGVLLVVFGIIQNIHDLSSFVVPVFGKTTTDLSESLGYFFELFLAAIVMFTPFCGVSCAIFFKVAFELTFGKNAQVNVFHLSPFLNIVMATICIFLFFYSLYQQYKWAIRLTQPLPTKKSDKDLARLI